MSDSNNNKTLVAYASKHGATREIAEKISEHFSNKGIQNSLVPVEEVESLSQFENIILGSAVYIGQWQKTAVKFLKGYQEILASKNVWLFSTGPTGEGNPVELMKGWKFPEGLQPIADKIKPIDVAVFHGALDESKLNTFEKMTIKIVKAPIGDFRNWKKIEDWALEMINTIQTAKSN
jgi:menaquinone-dependent protoporphyrinogen oxidase